MRRFKTESNGTRNSKLIDEHGRFFPEQCTFLMLEIEFRMISMNGK